MGVAPKDLKFNGDELFIKLKDGETVRVIKTGKRRAAFTHAHH